MNASVLTRRCDARGTWLVSLHGEHDLATRPDLEARTRAIWRVCRAAVIDFSDTDFIDTSIIRWLLEVERELEQAGASTMSVVEGRPGSVAERLFRHLNLAHVFACYPTRDAALDQLPEAQFRIRPALRQAA